MNINENRIRLIVKETIEDFFRNLNKGGLTPYTDDEAKRNREAMIKPRGVNSSLDEFRQWKAQMGRPNAPYSEYLEWKRNNG